MMASLAAGSLLSAVPSGQRRVERIIELFSLRRAGLACAFSLQDTAVMQAVR